MVITVLWAELWFVVVHCNLAKSVGIVHILIRINVGYLRYIEQEREDILVAYGRYHRLPSPTQINLSIRESVSDITFNYSARNCPGPTDLVKYS